MSMSRASGGLARTSRARTPASRRRAGAGACGPVVGTLAAREHADRWAVQLRARSTLVTTIASPPRTGARSRRAGWITDQARVEVVINGHRLTQQRVGVEPALSALRDRELAELLAGRAVLVSDDGVRAWRRARLSRPCRRGQVVAHAAVELIHHRVVRRDRVRVRRDQDHRVCLARRRSLGPLGASAMTWPRHRRCRGSPR